MQPEVYFLRYAFTCAHILKERGSINEEQLIELESAAIACKPLPRDYLEKIFPRAFEKINIVAKDLGLDYWDIRVLKEYFRIRHNEMLKRGDYEFKDFPQTLRDLCMVHEGEITDIIKKEGFRENFLIVEYNNGGIKRRPVSDLLIGKAGKGEKVTIHYGHAVEKV